MARSISATQATPRRTLAQELAFIRSQQAMPVASASVKTPQRDVDPAYEQWKREMGLDRPLTREAYHAIFDPCAVC